MGDLGDYLASLTPTAYTAPAPAVAGPADYQDVQRIANPPAPPPVPQQWVGKIVSTLPSQAPRPGEVPRAPGAYEPYVVPRTAFGGGADYTDAQLAGDPSYAYTFDANAWAAATSPFRKSFQPPTGWEAIGSQGAQRVDTPPPQSQWVRVPGTPPDVFMDGVTGNIYDIDRFGKVRLYSNILNPVWSDAQRGTAAILAQATRAGALAPMTPVPLKKGMSWTDVTMKGAPEVDPLDIWRPTQEGLARYLSQDSQTAWVQYDAGKRNAVLAGLVVAGVLSFGAGAYVGAAAGAAGAAGGTGFASAGAPVAAAAGGGAAAGGAGTGFAASGVAASGGLGWGPLGVGLATGGAGAGGYLAGNLLGGEGDPSKIDWTGVVTQFLGGAIGGGLAAYVGPTVMPSLQNAYSLAPVTQETAQAAAGATVKYGSNLLGSGLAKAAIPRPTTNLTGTMPTYPFGLDSARRRVAAYPGY